MRRRTQHDPAGAVALRVPEIAQLYSIGESIIWTAIKAGELEASKLGPYTQSPVIVQRPAIDRWLERRRYRPGQAA